MAKLIEKTYKTSDGRTEISTYQAEFYDAGRHPKRRRITLRTKDKANATRKLVELEKKVALGVFDPWTDATRREGVLVTDAIAKFNRAKKEEDIRPKTLANYAAILRIFGGSLPPDYLIARVEPRNVERFLDGQALNDTSRQTYLRHLRTFFRWCQQENLLQTLPMPAKKKNGRKPKRQVAEFLTRQQYQHLLSTIEAAAVVDGRGPNDILWLADVVRVAVSTGLRRGELCRLKWSDVDFTSGFLTVRESKSGHERSVYLTGDARTVLERLNAARTSEADDFVLTGAGGGMLNGNFAAQRFRDFREKAKLPESIHFHSLRHTFASWAVLGGMDLFKLKEILGHADIKMTMIYAHLRPDAQRGDMERIFGTENGERLADARQQDLLDENARLKAENEQLRAELERLQHGTPSKLTGLGSVPDLLN